MSEEMHATTDGDGKHSTTDQTNGLHTVWPMDILTQSTEDAIVSGKLVEANPDDETIEFKPIDGGRHLTVDISRSSIAPFFFENEPTRIRLVGVETELKLTRLKVFTTEQTTATVNNGVRPSDDRLVVPASNSSGYEVNQ